MLRREEQRERQEADIQEGKAEEDIGREEVMLEAKKQEDGGKAWMRQPMGAQETGWEKKKVEGSRNQQTKEGRESRWKQDIKEEEETDKAREGGGTYFLLNKGSGS